MRAAGWLPLAAALLSILLSAAPCPQADLVGVDAFGRAFGPVDSLRSDRQVGLFYWPWIGQPHATGVYDATKILALPDGLRLLTDPSFQDEQVSPNRQAHWWGEPLWGYYNSDDEWVIRKQMQMITLAGVDFIFFDHTNAVIYGDVVLKVCKVIREMQQEGWNPPRIASYTHSRSFQTVRALYDLLYRNGRYAETWYRVDGKPLIIAYTDPADDRAEAASRGDTAYDPGTLSPEIRSCFHFFKPDWPSDPTYPDGFTWIEWKFPQPYHTESGMMNVTVASHPMVPMSFSLTRENWTNWGRGWDPATQRNVAEDVDRGTFFQAQWDEALKADPPMVSVGGWNEWIAYKQPWDGEYMLCDAATKEYSRDIEPMKGGYEDAFYLQLIRNILRYKGAGDGRGAVPAHRIRWRNASAGWEGAPYAVRNTDAAFLPRDAFGNAKTVRYTAPAPARKLVEVRVAHDRKHLYFRIEAKEDFGRLSGEELTLLIGCGQPGPRAWECYDYVVGRRIRGRKASIERLAGGRDVLPAGEAALVLDGNVLQIRIPRRSIGLKAADRFYFKVASDVPLPGDIMDTYLAGSAIPMGRLSYLYVMQDPARQTGGCARSEDR